MRPSVFYLILSQAASLHSQAVEGTKNPQEFFLGGGGVC